MPRGAWRLLPHDQIGRSREGRNSDSGRAGMEAFMKFHQRLESSARPHTVGIGKGATCKENGGQHEDVEVVSARVQRLWRCALCESVLAVRQNARDTSLGGWPGDPLRDTHADPSTTLADCTGDKG